MGIKCHFFLKRQQSFLYIFLIFLLLIISISSKIYANTNVGGQISQNTTWTKTNSPYYVMYDVEIYGDTTNSVSLTIEPGVEIQFFMGSAIKVGKGKNRGILRAQGMDTEKIVFTQDKNTYPPALPTNGYWKNIYIDNGAEDYDTITGMGTILENCIIEYGGKNSYSDEESS